MSRDSHDDWRELNYWHKFTDVPCRYDDSVGTGRLLYKGAVVNVDGSITLRVPSTLAPGFEVALAGGPAEVELRDFTGLNWSDHDLSDPFADVARGIAAFRAANDRPPGRLVISRRLRDALLGHPL
ncbi:MAG TPA: hypothetical protein VNN79_16900, partial [Actinomycetota bacterium]|nr:hypothetical protein [Actinomycetota bacterium]